MKDLSRAARGNLSRGSGRGRWCVSTEGEGDRVGRKQAERGDPIALTLAASGVSTSPAPAGEVYACLARRSPLGISSGRISPTPRPQNPLMISERAIGQTCQP